MPVIGSSWAQSGIGHSHAYCAAKGALLAFSRNLAVELGPRGISVNAVSPGPTDTAMAAEYSEEERAEECERIALGRYAQPEEIATLIAYLASDGSSYITGQTLAMNGGEVICGY